MSNKNIYKDIFIHESSYIDKNVIIGKGTKIWHFNNILKDSKIGNNCTLGQNVSLGPNVIIGNRVKIQNNVSVYDGVTLEEGVFCGPSCVFTNDKNPRSRIVQKKVTRTLVKRYAAIGANATIICGVTIGEYALIGAGTVISKNVQPYALVVGVPGKQVSWVSEEGEILDLPLTGNAEAICKLTNKRYRLKDGQVNIVN